MINYYLDDQSRIVSLTMDRDQKRNAFNRELAEQLISALQRAEDGEARVVVLRAKPGARVWCAGHDLNELDPQNLHAENPTLRVVERIQSTPLPVIAMVEGAVFAGGLLLLLSADIVVAAENADIAITSAKLGVPLSPDLYAMWLGVMGIHQAKELLFTAAPISAADAHHAGLYNHLVSCEQLEQTTFGLAQRITENSPAVIANAKHQLNQIARQLCLGDSEREQIDRWNAEILNSRETRDRIAAILAAVRKEQ